MEKFADYLKTIIKENNTLDTPMSDNEIVSLREYLKNEFVQELKNSTIVLFSPSLETGTRWDKDNDTFYMKKKFYNDVIAWLIENGFHTKVRASVMERIHKNEEVEMIVKMY